jgi:hypothetical protein
MKVLKPVTDGAAAQTGSSRLPSMRGGCAVLRGLRIPGSTEEAFRGEPEE